MEFTRMKMFFFLHAEKRTKPLASKTFSLSLSLFQITQRHHLPDAPLPFDKWHLHRLNHCQFNGSNGKKIKLQNIPDANPAIDLGMHAYNV